MLKFILMLACSILFTAKGDAQEQHYTWEKLNTDPYKGKQDDIFFINKDMGWYVNGYGKIYHTQNGGETWTMQLEQKGTFFRCIAFIDSLTGFAGTVGTDYFPNVTDSVPLYKTLDGGQTWIPVNYSGPYVKGLCAIDIVKEEFNNHGEIGYKYHIYAVGRVGGPAGFMVSHDHGNTFSSHDMNQDCKALYDIKMFNKHEGYVCASTDEDMEKSHGCILYTANSGDSWTKVFESKRPFENTWKLFFPTRQTGYATIQHYNPDTTITVQHFLKTINGGKKWKEYTLCDDYKARPFGVGFIDDHRGFIGTLTSGFQTTDGGKTWEKTDLGRACNKIRIVHSPGEDIYGYAIGVNVYRLKNGNP